MDKSSIGCGQNDHHARWRRYQGVRRTKQWWAALLAGLVSVGAGVITFVIPGLTVAVLMMRTFPDAAALAVVGSAAFGSVG
jgi:hypothetical protein